MSSKAKPGSKKSKQSLALVSDPPPSGSSRCSTRNANQGGGKKSTGEPKRGREVAKGKKTAAGKTPQPKLKHEAMWIHFDNMLKNATDEDMIEINARISDVIRDFLKENKN